MGNRMRGANEFIFSDGEDRPSLYSLILELFSSPPRQLSATPEPPILYPPPPLSLSSQNLSSSPQSGLPSSPPPPILEANEPPRVSPFFIPRITGMSLDDMLLNLISDVPDNNANARQTETVMARRSRSPTRSYRRRDYSHSRLTHVVRRPAYPDRPPNIRRGMCGRLDSAMLGCISDRENIQITAPEIESTTAAPETELPRSPSTTPLPPSPPLPPSTPPPPRRRSRRLRSRRKARGDVAGQPSTSDFESTTGIVQHRMTLQPHECPTDRVQNRVAVEVTTDDAAPFVELVSSSNTTPLQTSSQPETPILYSPPSVSYTPSYLLSLSPSYWSVQSPLRLETNVCATVLDSMVSEIEWPPQSPVHDAAAAADRSSSPLVDPYTSYTSSSPALESHFLYTPSPLSFSPSYLSTLSPPPRSERNVQYSTISESEPSGDTQQTTSRPDSEITEDTIMRFEMMEMMEVSEEQPEQLEQTVSEIEQRARSPVRRRRRRHSPRTGRKDDSRRQTTTNGQCQNISEPGWTPNQPKAFQKMSETGRRSRSPSPSRSQRSRSGSRAEDISPVGRRHRAHSARADRVRDGAERRRGNAHASLPTVFETERRSRSPLLLRRTRSDSGAADARRTTRDHHQWSSPADRPNLSLSPPFVSGYNNNNTVHAAPQWLPHLQHAHGLAYGPMSTAYQAQPFFMRQAPPHLMRPAPPLFMRSRPPPHFMRQAPPLYRADARDNRPRPFPVTPAPVRFLQVPPYPPHSQYVQQPPWPVQLGFRQPSSQHPHAHFRVPRPEPNLPRMPHPPRDSWHSDYLAQDHAAAYEQPPPYSERDPRIPFGRYQ